MKHYVIFKYGRTFWEKMYDYYGDLDTARKFQRALSDSYHCTLILVEVI